MSFIIMRFVACMYIGITRMLQTPDRSHQNQTNILSGRVQETLVEEDNMRMLQLRQDAGQTKKKRYFLATFGACNHLLCTFIYNEHG